MTNRGFTLIEFMVAIAIFVIVFISALSFFTDSYRRIIWGNRYTAGKMALLHAGEALDRDLTKAGFGMDPDSGDPLPVEWDGVNHILTIRYIDYDQTTPVNCEDEVLVNGKSWSTISASCKYEIEYYLSDNNLLRYVDQGADGTGSSYPMFDTRYVKVEAFTANVSQPTVSYVIDATIQSREYKVAGKIICRNWY